MAEWTNEIKARVIKEYEEADPTPETTVEIVKEIAENLGDDYTANGVMAVLIKAKNPDGSSVYVRKTPTTGAKKSNGDSKRVSKADSINELTNLIEAAGLEVDSDIVGKLTGKAAVYFANVISKISEQD